MTFRSLALSNIRGNWRSYSAFFLSSVFSVLIFYIYAAFLFHPEVVSGYIVGASKVRTGMEFCLYLIVVFSFLFILYSNSAFLKTRKQEFGLFSLFGMTRSQLRKLVIFENVGIAVFAIAAGIGLGILFSKLFFMALAVLLNMNETIPFAVPLKAVGITAGGFFTLFMLISLGTTLRIGRTEIIDLLRAARQPKGELLFSRWLVAVAVICLGAAYGMAYTMTGNTFAVYALPILITVVIGTYFLFTQLSVFLLRIIQKRHGLFYKRTNMLVFAQLGFKIRDNARILFTVSIMSAVIMTAMGAVYIMQIQGKDQLIDSSPYSIGFIERGLNSHEVLKPEELQHIVAKDGFSIKREAKVVGIGLSSYNVNLIIDHKNREINFSSGDEQRLGMIIAARDYNKLAKEQGHPSIQPEIGKLVLIQSNYNNEVMKSGQAAGEIQGEKLDLPISQWVNAAVMNKWLNSNSVTLVADDQMYDKLLQSVPESEQLVFYGYELSNWERSAPTVQKLNSLIPAEKTGDADLQRAEFYENQKEVISLTLFIGMFISLLFFIAAGSMIYFKLFTELQEDQAQFKALNRIGMTKSEIRRIVVSQIGIIFFVPCVVGIVHALFAMKSLDNLMGTSNWFYSFVVIGIYVGMQMLYFLLASNSYMKSMLRGRTT